MLARARGPRPVLGTGWEGSVDVVVLMPYAYWPPGKYAFDNLVLRAITEEEAKQWQTRRTKNGVPLEK